jgi:phosphodiesterase/alkaline phosphatase D-like protein
VATTLALLALAFAGCEGDSAAASATAAFTHGVASGDVTAGSAVLWTRAEGGDALTVEVSESEGFAGDVLGYDAQTSPSRDFTVKVIADGLKASTRYYYRFRAGDGVSAIGTFITAPDDSTSEPLRFVFSGDSDGRRHADGSPAFNEFDVLDAAATEDPAFFLYFGDTIYADREPEAATLDEYRGKYKQNRRYPALAGILAATSTYNVWDDHEVYNDFAGATVERVTFEVGRQAFREYMPIDDSGEQDILYRAFRWGADVDLILLDERSFRDASAAQACEIDGQADPLPAAATPGAPDALRGIRAFVGLPAELPEGCADLIDDASRTLLGEDQKRYFFDWLASSDATWKIVVNSVPIQMLLALPYDRWEGYSAERREVLEFIRANDIKNVVFLTTDFHANIFGPVRMDAFTDNDPIAYEAIAGPIATTPLQQDIVDVIGEDAAGVLGAFFEGLLQVDCADLNSYAYALVELDATSMTITAKDHTGRELCRTRLEART